MSNFKYIRLQLHMTPYQKAAEGVLVFVREAVTRFPNLQPSIIEKLLNSLASIKTINVMHVSLQSSKG